MMPAFLKRWLISKLFKLVFPLDFVEMDERKRFETYKKMNADDDIKLLIRSMYTRNYQACTLEDDHDSRLVIKGRMLQLRNFIDMMEGSTEILENWEKRQKITNRVKQLKKRLTNNSTTV